MNVNSGGPHILLFERDQQLTTLLSGELAQAGYEVHTARTAVEVFDAIARFPVRLVMVDLAQAQAGRREFWVALDAQRRGRGVQVFTFRCTNLGGYGPDDPDERMETVLTDLEVDGPGGIARLVSAVRGRVPGSTVTTSAPTRPATSSQPQEGRYQSARPTEAPLPPPLRQASPVYQPPRQASPAYQSAPMPQVTSVRPSASTQKAAPVPQQMPMPQVPPSPTVQPLQGTLRPQPQETPVMPPRPAEPPRSAHSTFTDKIRAVFYPSSQSFSSVPETPGSSYGSGSQNQQYQNPDAQPRPHASQRFAEAEHTMLQNNREEMTYQPPANVPSASLTQSYSNYGVSPANTSAQPIHEESGLDQLTRLLRESKPRSQNTGTVGAMQNIASRPLTAAEAQPTQDFRTSSLSTQATVFTNSAQSAAPRPPTTVEAQPAQDFHSSLDAQATVFTGNTQNTIPRLPTATEAQPMQDARPPLNTQATAFTAAVQNAAPRPGLSIDPQEIQDFRSQIMQAARQDEAQERALTTQTRSAEIPSINSQLRASPIQDIPFEQEVAHRKGSTGSIPLQAAEVSPRPAPTLPQPAQTISPFQSYAQLSPQAEPAFTDSPIFAGSSTQPRPGMPPETLSNMDDAPSFSSLSPAREVSPQLTLPGRNTSGSLHLDENVTLPEQVRASLQQTISRRPEVRTSDDMLLDIVKSLPPMSPAPQPPQPQPQVLNGRATRSLGSVLLEGHLVPQERLQVAQHVQRMLRGVDLNYQLGEILLMFKLLTPDQLLAASLVSYDMISTIQISSLGRIRQELHAMGLEYDLESLLVLFRILSPEQLREVRASWSS